MFYVFNLTIDLLLTQLEIIDLQANITHKANQNHMKPLLARLYENLNVPNSGQSYNSISKPLYLFGLLCRLNLKVFFGLSFFRTVKIFDLNFH